MTSSTISTASGSPSMSTWFVFFASDWICFRPGSFSKPMALTAAMMSAGSAKFVR